MKNKLIFMLLIAIFAISIKAYSQASSAVGTNLPSTSIDYLGWAAGSNSTLTNPQLDIKNEDAMPIKFYTNAGSGTYNFQRMIIFDGSGSPSNAGFVGIGTNFSAPMSLLHLHDPSTGPSLAVYHQWTNGTTGATASDGLRIGIDLNGVAQIIQQETLPIDFYNGGNHNLRIDYTTRDLDVINPTSGYEIGDPNSANNNLVLWHNGNTTRIYVGVAAGNGTSTGVNNTFVGNQTAPGIGLANDNTLVGFQAGTSITTAINNTILGSGAGAALTINGAGSSNVFVGYLSGGSAVGEGNTFLGTASGQNSNGSNAVYIGNGAGINATNSNNVFIGAASGVVNTGAQNTFVGYHTGNVNVGAQNNSFFGTSAGQFNTGGQNTFIGTLAGGANAGGDFNTFLGYWSGHVSTGGTRNTYIGTLAGEFATGSYNTYVGMSAGDGQTGGDYNTYLGFLAHGTSGVDDQTAIGHLATCVVNKTMILGNNDVKVGIGLSSDVFGPQRKLDILDGSSTDPQLRLTHTQVSAANPALGIHTDFQATGAGDLYIHPSTDASGTPVDGFVGINQFGPGNTLEINSGITANIPARLISGLRFTNLNSGTPNSEDIPSANGRVLTVDANGDVGLTPQNGNTGFGQCNTPAVLTSDIGMDFSNHTVYFQDPSVVSSQRNEVGIGYSCGAPQLDGKLSVLSQTTTNGNYNYTHRIAGRFYETGDYNSATIIGGFIGAWGNSDVQHYSGADKNDNIGGDFYASRSFNFNFGARGTANSNYAGRN